MLTTVVHEWSLLAEEWGTSMLAKGFPSLTKEMANMDNWHVAEETFYLLLNS